MHKGGSTPSRGEADRTGPYHGRVSRLVEEPAPLEVVFIVGNQRSGSTLLVNLLGELDSVFGAGELYNLWDRSLRRPTAQCSCKELVRSCPVWSAVLESMKMPGGGEIDPPTVRRWQRQAVGGRRPWAKATPTTAEYRQVMGDLYRAIAGVTGASTVIDSSKSPAYAATLAAMPGISTSVVHLVRDPRGIVYSRQRGWKSWERSTAREGRTLPASTVARIVLAWIRANLAAELLTRRKGMPAVRIRYEDLAADPATTLRRITDLVGLASEPLPLDDDHTARFGLQHVAAGNPSRFRTGSLVLKEDRAWAGELPRRHRLLAAVLAAPLMYRYGYRPGKARPARPGPGRRRGRRP